MFVSIRKYHTTDVAEVARQVEDAFVPVLRGQPGFIAYYLVDCGGGWVSTISMFETQAGAQDSAPMAADWLAVNIAGLVDSGPEVLMGETLVAQVG